ncbi:MAG: recombination protein RecR [Kiritimatiellae bacterium]|nr:recombination protein RecR [Kiritimatiellia bacterium]
MAAVEALQRLVTALGKLPGVGRRSAERMAMRLAVGRRDLIDELLASLAFVQKSVTGCAKCGSPTLVDENPCRLCTSPGREDGLLCVVEEPADIATIERSGGFRGRYHALMGTLSPPKGQGPADLRVQSLVARVREEGISEVVLALNTDVEGDATAAFLEEALRGEPVKVSRLAFGLPAGSGIRYSDPVTLERAFKGRM